MPISTLNTDLHVGGALSANSMTLPTASVTKEKIAAAAAIETSKMIHKHRINFPMGIVTGGPTAGTYRVHTVKGASGLVMKFSAGFTTKPTVNDWEIDLKKNGSTILTAVITLGTGITNEAVNAAVISSAAIAVDDRLEVVIVDNTSTGGLGLFVNL